MKANILRKIGLPLARSLYILIVFFSPGLAAENQPANTSKTFWSRSWHSKNKKEKKKERAQVPIHISLITLPWNKGKFTSIRSPETMLLWLLKYNNQGLQPCLALNRFWSHAIWVLNFQGRLAHSLSGTVSFNSGSLDFHILRGMGPFTGDLNKELFQNSGNDLFILVSQILGGKCRQLMCLLSLTVLFSESVVLSTDVFKTHNCPSQNSLWNPWGSLYKLFKKINNPKVLTEPWNKTSHKRLFRNTVAGDIRIWLKKYSIS